MSNLEKIQKGMRVLQICLLYTSTKNGEGDLVVMDIETYNRREKMLKLREELLAVEEDRMRGNKGYSVDEVAAMMRSAIKEAAGHGTAE